MRLCEPSAVRVQCDQQTGRVAARAARRAGRTLLSWRADSSATCRERLALLLSSEGDASCAVRSPEARCDPVCARLGQGMPRAWRARRDSATEASAEVDGRSRRARDDVSYGTSACPCRGRDNLALRHELAPGAASCAASPTSRATDQRDASACIETRRSRGLPAERLARPIASTALPVSTRTPDRRRSTGLPALTAIQRQRAEIYSACGCEYVAPPERAFRSCHGHGSRGSLRTARRYDAVQGDAAWRGQLIAPSQRAR